MDPPRRLHAARRAQAGDAQLGYHTHGDLAEAIGVSRSSVSLWVQGKVGVPRPVAMLIRMMVAAQRRAY
jgi:transcriptional regulator with XRE-family HTH domain